jgi:hypothetical protein
VKPLHQLLGGDAVLVGEYLVEMNVVFSVPPGTTRERAAQMLSQGGINVPLGLLQYVRSVNINVVDAPVGEQEVSGIIKLR